MAWTFECGVPFWGVRAGREEQVLLSRPALYDNVDMRKFEKISRRNELLFHISWEVAELSRSQMGENR